MELRNLKKPVVKTASTKPVVFKGITICPTRMVNEDLVVAEPSTIVTYITLPPQIIRIAPSKMTIGIVAPSNPTIGDLWLDINE